MRRPTSLHKSLAYAFVPLPEPAVKELWAKFVVTRRDAPEGATFIPAMEGAFVVLRSKTSQPFLQRVRAGFSSVEARTMRAFEDLALSLAQPH